MMATPKTDLKFQNLKFKISLCIAKASGHAAENAIDMLLSQSGFHTNS
jgi:hypothetical protein